MERSHILTFPWRRNGAGTPARLILAIVSVLSAPDALAGPLAIPFVENRGQVGDEVAYHADIPAGTLFLTRDGRIIYELYAAETGRAVGCTVREELMGTESPRPRGKQPTPTAVSYFRGEDPDRWMRSLPTWSSVEMAGVYPGIDLELRAHEGNVEKLFHLRPGARPEVIRLDVSGVTGLMVAPDGGLEALTEHGALTFTPPVAYQERGGERVQVDVAYETSGSDYGFRLGEYDPDLPLTIDPLLGSTYLGGSNREGDDYTTGFYIAKDENHVYMATCTRSADYPGTAGGFDAYHNGHHDIAIAKLDEDLTTLLSCTFLGGLDNDLPGQNGPTLLLAGNGDVYVAGFTFSFDFPTTPGAFDRNYSGGTDVVLCRLTHDLSDLVASTFLGGYGYDDYPSIALDDSGNVYVAGRTTHGSFPFTPAAFDTTYNGDDDYFVAKLDADLTTLSAATFLGGSVTEGPSVGIGLDAQGDPVLAGRTNSADYPVSPGAHDESFGGWSDVVISKLSPDLGTLLASTFVGKSDFEGGFVMEVGDGGVYVGGHTTSLDYPTTPGVYDETHQGFNDYFITKLNTDLDQIMASTFLSGPDSTFGFVTDLVFGPDETLYMCGHTMESTFPTTPGSYDEEYNGGDFDGFVMAMSADLTSLEASSFFGGSGYDACHGIALDMTDRVYLTGYTTSPDLPATAGAYDSSFNGGDGDGFMAVLDHALSAGVVSSGFPTVPRPGLRLQSSQPNPFSSHTRIRYELAGNAAVRLEIVTVGGRVIRTLVEEWCAPGIHSAVWDGMDQRGRAVPAGVYFCRLTAGEASQTIKMTHVR
jgi:hypothetical protein